MLLCCSVPFAVYVAHLFALHDCLHMLSSTRVRSVIHVKAQQMCKASLGLLAAQLCMPTCLHHEGNRAFAPELNIPCACSYFTVSQTSPTCSNQLWASMATDQSACSPAIAPSKFRSVLISSMASACVTHTACISHCHRSTALVMPFDSPIDAHAIHQSLPIKLVWHCR